MAYIGVSPSNGVRRVHTYTATASQTTFSGAGAEGTSLSYKDSNYVDVYQNGVKLGDADYTATSGTSIVLGTGATASDLVVVVVFDVFSVADTVSKADGGTFDGNVTMAGTLDVTGNGTVGGTLAVTGNQTNSGNLTVSGAFTSQGIDDNADAVAITIDSSENVGVGTTSPADKLHIVGSNGATSRTSFQTASQLVVENNSDTSIDISTGTTHSGYLNFHDTDAVQRGYIGYGHTNDLMVFGTAGSERMRINSSGDVTVNKTSTSSSVGGVLLKDGQSTFTRGGGQVVLFNRQGGDGAIVGFASADATEGTVSISGSTTSYNAFSASHWSRLTDNSKPTILKGTVIETIDEMMDWYQLTFTVPATDDTPEHSPKISITLEDGQSVGDTITYNYNGTDYQATIIKEADNKHPKCKISDTADSTRVYGVFADWDNDDDTVNDMYVTAVGTHVVRVNSSVTVSAGDLLTSNGDGTAKVQDDDIIRSKTIGKVLTNIKQETYDDGSYTVPCALYCG